MKIRNGFVSNSSSSSFIINFYDMSEKKKNKIIKKIKSCKYDDQEYRFDSRDHWFISEYGKSITGSTIMKNYDFPKYIEKVFKQVFGKNWKKKFAENVLIESHE